jgi:glutathione S-transferase
MGITLYHAIRSANSERVLLALFEKRLRYQHVILSLERRDQKAPDFLKLNPYGKVPVLVDDGKVLFESLIINDYLDERYPSPALWPSDPYLRGRGRVLTDYAVNYLQEDYWPLRVEMRKDAARRDYSIVDSKRKILAGLLGYLEDAIQESPFLIGAFSLADLNVWPRLSRLEAYGVLPNASLPRLSAWLGRMKQRPSVQSLGPPSEGGR